jgi:predicted nucleotidyltransferase
MSKIDAIFLYGSRARGDGGRSSDVDLLGVVSSLNIEKPFDRLGISLHLYPLEWLKNQAADGSLFLSHIVHEAVPINDPLDVLGDLRQIFRFRQNYDTDIAIGCKIMLALIGLKSENVTKGIIRRYYWGLRTALMGAAANGGSPIFSASDLEKRFSIPGLANHINARNQANVEDCKHIGTKVYERLIGSSPPLDERSVLENLNTIFNLGGVATATAGEIIYDIN